MHGSDFRNMQILYIHIYVYMFVFMLNVYMFTIKRVNKKLLIYNCYKYEHILYSNHLIINI